MLLRCNLCDYQYESMSIKDVSNHDAIHAVFLERGDGVTKDIPLSAGDRENLYRKGINLIKESNLSSQYHGSLLLIKRDYNHSLHDAVINGYHEQHPTFDEYISMVFETYQQIPDRCKQQLREEFGSRRGEIAPNFVHWYPKGSRERDEQFLIYRRDYSNVHKTRRRLMLLHESSERGKLRHW